jgi:dTDP-4-dehydrorhamnose reductase
LTGLPGTFHVAGPEATTWHDVLLRCKAIGGFSGEVLGQRAADLGLSAARPAMSALRSVRLPSTDVTPMPPLDDALASVVASVG